MVSNQWPQLPPGENGKTGANETQSKQRKENYKRSEQKLKKQKTGKQRKSMKPEASFLREENFKSLARLIRKKFLKSQNPIKRIIREDFELYANKF